MLSEFHRLRFGGMNFFYPAKNVPLYAMMLNCGHQVESNTDYRWHGLRRGNREFAIWQYTVSGFGKLDYEGETYTVHPGDAVLLRIPHDHCYYFSTEADHWEFVYVSMNGREIMRIWRELQRQVGPIVRFDENSGTLKYILEIFKNAFSGEITTPFKSSATAYQLMMTVFEELGPSSKTVNEPEFVNRVIDYCLAHLDEPLTVDDMAEVAGYSRFHFSRMFAESQGMPPAAFLHDLRLKHSMRLLQTERSSIKEIATQCGFQDASNYCKAFRKAYKMSPGKFRKSASHS